MKRKLKMFRNELFIITYMIALFFILVSARGETTKIAYDITGTSAVKAIHLVSKYDPEETKEIVAKTFAEVTKYGSTNPVIFKGTITGYGPNCVGCSGYVACPPNPSVKKTTTYKDKKYGAVRIVAADRSIPCGTIVKITGSSEGKEIYAIVLDRGGVIKGTLMDLLFASEKETNAFGRQKVTYETIRWGW